MPIYVQKNLMTFPVAGEKLAIFCTTNGVIHKKRNALVMGKGAALDMKMVAWNCERVAANDIMRRLSQGKAVFRGTTANFDLYEYNLCNMGVWLNDVLLGGFQTKIHFRQNSDLGLIQESTRRLDEVARLLLPGYTIRLNYPGIGNGNLTREEVDPIISVLPDNVEIVYQ